MKKILFTIIGIALLICIVLAARLSQSAPDNAVITDMLLYEHDNSRFYIDVRFAKEGFDGVSSDKIELRIVDSWRFNVNAEPEPIRHATVNTIEIEYSSLPVNEVSDECTIITNAPVADKFQTPDNRNHDLYILDDKYLLFRYTDNEYFCARWWQPMYNSDRKTQAEILQYADYRDIDPFKFGPVYHATAEGQLQCIYKYGNCVYYRQIN